MNGNRFKLSKFRLENMVVDPAIVLVAKRGTGKSFITRDIMYHLRRIPGGIVISPTDRMDAYFKYFFPDIYIHYDINEMILQKLLYRQQLMKLKYKRKKKQGMKVNPSAILVMDDCLSRKKNWAKGDSVMQILMDGRHYKLTYLLTMQYPLGIGPELRGNFDYIFLLKENISTNRKRLYDNYAGIFPTQGIFERFLNQCTQDFRCMVIDNRNNKSDDLQDKVFWFKAVERKFTFGSKSFKDDHHRFYDRNFQLNKNPFFQNPALLLPRKGRAGEVDFKVDFK